MKNLATAYSVVKNPNTSAALLDKIAATAKKHKDDELLKLVLSHPNVGPQTLRDNC